MAERGKKGGGDIAERGREAAEVAEMWQRWLKSDMSGSARRYKLISSVKLNDKGHCHWCI